MCLVLVELMVKEKRVCLGGSASSGSSQLETRHTPSQELQHQMRAGLWEKQALSEQGLLGNKALPTDAAMPPPQAYGISVSSRDVWSSVPSRFPILDQLEEIHLIPTHDAILSVFSHVHILTYGIPLQHHG